MSETDLIQKLTAGLPTDGSVHVGPGDDCAVVDLGMIGDYLLFKTDAIVEGIHFTRETIPWEDLGWKVVAANISDIASMGGTPLYALVTLGFPASTSVEDVESLYIGIARICEEYRTAIVGGDIVNSPTTFVTIALNGYLDGAPLLRSAARPGDIVAATGFLGSARGGLEMMLHGESVEP